jgi:hypothetical protein
VQPSGLVARCVVHVQVAYDQRGEVAAVRYEVEAVAPKQASTGVHRHMHGGTRSRC